MFEKISSFQNSKIKLTKKLRDKKSREREQLFIVDYERDLERALKFNYKVDFMFYSPELDSNQQGLELIRQWQLEPYAYEVNADLMDKVAYRSNPASVVAIIKSKALSSLEAMQLSEAHRCLVLVDLKKPGNIGALLRTADATGIDSVVLVDSVLDIYNPNIIRSSTGACFRQNVYFVTTAEAITFFRDNQFQLFGTHVDSNTSLYDVSFPDRTAIIMGTEDVGLDAFWSNKCDQLVTIPMQGEVVDSLNVSVSGAVVMYEILRQKR